MFRIEDPTSAGINGNGRFNKVKFTGNRIGILFSSAGLTYSDVGTRGQSTFAFTTHGQSFEASDNIVRGTYAFCVIAGCRVAKALRNDVIGLQDDFFATYRTYQYTATQGVFADDYGYVEIADNAVRNEIDYTGYASGSHPDFIQIRGFNNEDYSPWGASSGNPGNSARAPSNWAAGHLMVTLGQSPPRIYRVASVTTGITGTTAPTGTGTGIVDGGVTWNYVNTRDRIYGTLHLLVTGNTVNSAHVLANSVVGGRQFILDNSYPIQSLVKCALYDNIYGGSSSYGISIGLGELIAEYNTFALAGTIQPGVGVTGQYLRMSDTGNISSWHNVLMTTSAKTASKLGLVSAYDEVFVQWDGSAASPLRPTDVLNGPFAQQAGSSNIWGYTATGSDGSGTIAAFRANLKSILTPLTGTAGAMS
jgi:hypothetical protein